MEEIGGEEKMKAGKSMAPALIAAHPDGSCVVVAVGAALRIFNLLKEEPVQVQDDTLPAGHGDVIRAVAFDLHNSLFASVGDDKLVKLWDATAWTCIKTVRLSKKASAVTFSHDSAWLLVADKFGIVYVFSTVRHDAIHKPVLILAHCCSIITGLCCSPDGKYIVTSDRDFKIRVTKFPENPLTGAHDIHTYCLGHTNFVACVAFIGFQGLLISGGGDATLRLWEYETGALLDTFDTTDEAGVSGQSQGTRAVVAVAVSSCNTYVGTILERFEGVLLFACDMVERQLSLLQKVLWSENAPPTSLSFDSGGNLWLVSGAAETVEMGDEFVTPEALAVAQVQAQGIAMAAVTHVQVVRDCVLLGGTSVPGGELLLHTLQGHQAGVQDVTAATEAAELAMKNLLSKRQYTAEQREHRKRMRNDKVVSLAS
ncbi:unnamed protein product [Sphagnum jensenii]|uniref:tRNA (guanine-N(7)-)-methyltransferase non-catalytic subunit n=1 Tax=Sphagnum jensenii TaxID=128206 RepID=A0ABP0WPC4_9BRYO